MRRFISAIGILIGSAVLAGGAYATPSMSRGEQKFNIDYQECMNRAARAFQSQGWANIGSGGAFVQAFRGSEGAYITCNQVGGVTVVNIFVASDSQDSGVPGYARQQLQTAMEGGYAPPPPPPPQQQQTQWVWTCCNGQWRGGMTLTFSQQQGSIVYFTGALGGELNGGMLSGQWNTATGSVTYDRDIGGGTSQHYVGTMVNDGGKLRMSGTWSGAYDDRAAHDWQAVQQ